MSEQSSIAVSVLKLFIGLYDTLTLPIYAILQAPWRNVHDNRRQKAAVIKRTKGGITWRANEKTSRLHKSFIADGIDTLEKMFSRAIRMHAKKRSMGTREILEERETMGQDGKTVKQLTLGDYKWITYEEVGRRADLFGAGLRELGAVHRERICLFAETNANWLISAIACCKQNFTVVTLYATLGDEGLLHGLNETECKYILTTQKLLPKLHNNIATIPFVKHIICLDNKPLEKNSNLVMNVEMHTFSEILDMGQDAKMATVSPPEPDEIAIIMYTSGSTGNPKGVLLSHNSVVSAVSSFADGFHGDDITNKDVCMGYLPLAHIFEFGSEALYFSAGVPIGYSSPFTLVDGGTMLTPGCKGDATVLRPTVMMIVPLLLERLYKGVLTKISGGSATAQSIFHFFYQYKLAWLKRGYKTPFVDAIIFRKIRNILGGRVKLMASGSAPLSPEVHEFMRTTLCTNLIQGYGLTETNACANICINADLRFGRIGRPLPGCDMQLVDWEEGNYTVEDRPYPRGEIVIGGSHVASGYFKLPELTASDFFVDETGKKWFRTGDIGEVHEDGVCKIIDRKKDLVKLQMGEYISLGKVESTLKLNNYVENICVYADSKQNSCIALVVPATNQILSLAKELGKDSGIQFEDACKDSDIQTRVTKEVQKQGMKSNLSKYEIPVAVRLISDLWTPDSGLVTAALKLRRKNIQGFYQQCIDEMYNSIAGHTIDCI